jgi:hypothetical protein
MKNLKVLKGLSRNEMRGISGGKLPEFVASCKDRDDCPSGEICCGMPGQTAYCQTCTCGQKC